MNIYLSKKQIKALLLMLHDAEGMLEGGNWHELDNEENSHLLNEVSDGVSELKEKLKKRNYTLESMNLSDTVDD